MVQEYIVAAKPIVEKATTIQNSRSATVALSDCVLGTANSVLVGS
jgi:hypothetical protein